jgi:hypothetical protein
MPRPDRNLAAHVAWRSEVELTMTRRGAIARIAKMIGQDIACGTPSQGATEAGPMLAQTGATPDLVACLIAETRRRRPDPHMVEAYAFLLESALDALRMAGNDGDTTARLALDEVRAAVGSAIAGDGLAAETLMLIARAFAQAELDPGQDLRDAALAAVEAEPAPPAAGGMGLGNHLADIARALDDDPFAIHAELAASCAALPIEHRAVVAAELAASGVAAVGDAAIGFVLDRDPAPGAAVLAALTQRARQHAVPSRLVERLVVMRPWLPPARRPALDTAIRSLRAKAEAPVQRAAGEVRALLASLCDGAGAQSLFGLTRRGRRFALASVLVKADAGVADAWVREDMTKREADEMVAEIRQHAEAVDVPLGLVTERLSDALAVNLKLDTPPPFGLLRVVETLGIGALHPAALAPATLAAALLDGLPPERTGAEATRAAHRNAPGWADRFHTLDSWFEAGEEIEALLRPQASRGKRIEAVLARHLPARRLFWAERCAWMAATLKDGGSDRDAAWVDFALVARDLAGAGTLADMPLMAAIADATVNVFAARPPARRSRKPRRH